MGVLDRTDYSLLYLFVFFKQPLAAHHLNGTVTEKCVVDLHVIQILIGICVYPHNDFIPLFYCNYNLHWKDRLSRKLCTKLHWDLSHHIIYDYCTLLLPHEAGDLPAGAFFLAFFYLSSSGTPALTSLHHRPKEK